MVSAGCLLDLHWSPSVLPTPGGEEEPGRVPGGAAVSRLGGVTVILRCSWQVAWRQ